MYYDYQDDENHPFCRQVPHWIQGRHQLPAPTVVLGGDLTKEQRAVGLLSNATAIAEAWI